MRHFMSHFAYWNWEALKAQQDAAVLAFSLLPLNGIFIIKEHLSWECVPLLVVQMTVGYMGFAIKVCDMLHDG